jgi:hypothetical protein
MIGTTAMSGALRNLTESIKPLTTNAKDFAQRYWRAISLLALLAVALAGYGLWPRTIPASTAMTAPTPAWSRHCVAGVSYLQFTSGVSVEWAPNSKVKTCSERKTDH